jgi:hypothetical protein
MIGVVTHRAVAFVMLVGEPKNAFLVKDAPNGRERVAKAEIDAAEFPAGGYRARADTPSQVREYKPFQSFKRTAVFLPEPRFAEAATFGGEELGRDARDARSGNLDAGPIVAAVGPSIVKEAALSVFASVLQQGR